MTKVDIPVVYKFVDGAHFFTSTHPLAKGLCAASVDLEEAYDDVPNQIKALLKYNHDDQDVVVNHAIPFKDFVKDLLTAMRAQLKTRQQRAERPKIGVTPRETAVVVKVSDRELEHV